jgi:hypothetical protein
MFWPELFLLDEHRIFMHLCILQRTTLNHIEKINSDSPLYAMWVQHHKYLVALENIITFHYRWGTILSQLTLADRLDSVDILKCMSRIHANIATYSADPSEEWILFLTELKKLKINLPPFQL